MNVVDNVAEIYGYNLAWIHRIVIFLHVDFLFKAPNEILAKIVAVTKTKCHCFHDLESGFALEDRMTYKLVIRSSDFDNDGEIFKVAKE